MFSSECGRAGKIVPLQAREGAQHTSSPGNGEPPIRESCSAVHAGCSAERARRHGGRGMHATGK